MCISYERRSCRKQENDTDVLTWSNALNGADRSVVHVNVSSDLRGNAE